MVSFEALKWRKVLEGWPTTNVCIMHRFCRDSRSFIGKLQVPLGFMTTYFEYWRMVKPAACAAADDRPIGEEKLFRSELPYFPTLAYAVYIYCVHLYRHLLHFWFDGSNSSFLHFLVIWRSLILLCCYESPQYWLNSIMQDCHYSTFSIIIRVEQFLFELYWLLLNQLQTILWNLKLGDLNV